MAYVRPVNKMPLSKQKKVDFLTEYAAYYRDAVAADDTALNRKIPRDAFIGLLQEMAPLLPGLLSRVLPCTELAETVGREGASRY